MRAWFVAFTAVAMNGACAPPGSVGVLALPEGVACSHDEQCASNICDDTNDTSTSEKRCAGCRRDDDCSDGNVCATGKTSTCTKTCAPPATSGEICALAAEDDPCNETAISCAAGLVCLTHDDGTLFRGTCEPPGQAGDACSASGTTSTCAGSLRCSALSTCVDASAPRADGDDCSANADCQSGDCTAELCLDFACNTDADCAGAGQTCAFDDCKSACTDALPEGARCATDAATARCDGTKHASCAAGLTCSIEGTTGDGICSR